MSAGMHQKLCILQARTYARISRHAQIIPTSPLILVIQIEALLEMKI